MYARMKWIILLFMVTAFAITAERVFVPETTQDMKDAARTYGTDQGKALPPLPFVYDGCTLFPDNLPGLDLTQPCFEHDIAYWHGGTQGERKEADRRLKEAVSAQGVFGQFMQLPVYIGVRLFGDSFLTRMFNAHWGFGWK
tara:strand:- start:1015 stop:1437 length:423 start_codon:yes stop_codon:yes gene_type:complete